MIDAEAHEHNKKVLKVVREKESHGEREREKERRR